MKLCLPDIRNILSIQISKILIFDYQSAQIKYTFTLYQTTIRLSLVHIHFELYLPRRLLFSIQTIDTDSH